MQTAGNPPFAAVTGLTLSHVVDAGLEVELDDEDFSLLLELDELSLFFDSLLVSDLVSDVVLLVAFESPFWPLRA